MSINQAQAGKASSRDSTAAGEWRTRIGRTFPLSEAAEAHRVLAAGHTGGKVILAP